MFDYPGFASFADQANFHSRKQMSYFVAVTKGLLNKMVTAPPGIPVSRPGAIPWPPSQLTPPGTIHGPIGHGYLEAFLFGAVGADFFSFYFFEEGSLSKFTVETISCRSAP